MISVTEKSRLLDLEWDFPQVGPTTIRGYLCALLAAVWRNKCDFDFKRAFGFSHWRRDLLPPLIAAGAIDPVADGEDLAVSLLMQDAALDAVIASLIEQMSAPPHKEIDHE